MPPQNSSKITIAGYLKETQAELKKIIWPTRQEMIRDTLVVVIGSLAVGVLLALFDGIFAKGLQLLLDLKR